MSTEVKHGFRVYTEEEVEEELRVKKKEVYYLNTLSLWRKNIRKNKKI